MWKKTVIFTTDRHTPSQSASHQFLETSAYVTHHPAPTDAFEGRLGCIYCTVLVFASSWWALSMDDRGRLRNVSSSPRMCRSHFLGVTKASDRQYMDWWCAAASTVERVSFAVPGFIVIQCVLPTAEVSATICKLVSCVDWPAYRTGVP